ncbi:MAG: hypothetical protein EOO65_04960 [Methanosarcinales archaeon]|nr:MAG: hypothetical protein EOO65_04960 [Methanosarcinales archaeon]
MPAPVDCSDVFEEGGFVSQPYHEGFGMQTIYQVPKPVYRAFEMIAHQPRLALPLSVSGATETVITRPGSVSVGTVDVSVTVAAVDAKQTRVHALLVNYNTPDNAIAAQTVTVQVNNLPRAAPSTATLRIVDSTHAYAFPVWQAAGSPMYPNQTEVATELSASRVAPTSIALSASGSKASFTVTLQPQSVTTVEFIV